MIEQVKRADYSQRNAKYNQLVATLVDDLLGTRAAYPEYVPIREFKSLLPSAAQARREIHVVKGPQPRPSKAIAEFDTDGLDVYEQVVFTSLAWGSYDLYCVVGEMGSGKTALAGQIAKVLKRKRRVECDGCKLHKCNPVVIHLDFNEGFADKSVDVIISRFERRLYSQLKALLRDLFKNDFDVAEFVDHAKRRENLTAFADFDDFIEDIEDNETWNGATNKQRAERLFLFIKGHTDLGYQIELLMRLLGYARTNLLPEPACVVIIYDNLDKIQYEAQMEILHAVMSYQEIAKVRALVPLRRTSFEKLGTQRIYSFGAINHTGPSPIDIIRRRINHYTTNFDNEPLIKSLDSTNAAALRRRLNYLASILSHNTGYVIDTLRSIPGDSVRLGLFMMVRAVVNNTMPYDGETTSMTDVIRAVLVANNDDELMAFNDDVVANIFHDGQQDRTPSLICIRILGILNEFADAASKRTLGNICATLREIGGWRIRDVLYALNYLMNPKRPLVWADGRTQFNLALERKGEIPTKEVLFISSAGEAYLRKLSLQLAYFQECVITLDWRSQNVPASFDASDIDSRMGMVRRCFREFQAMDVKQYGKFAEHISRNERQTLPLVLFSNRLWFGLAQAGLLIFRKHRETTGKIAEEWRAWHDQTIQSLNVETELTSGKRNGYLSTVEKSYSTALAEASRPAAIS